MRIGYLHIGEPQHGIVRYGRLLAAEAKKRSELTVIETELALTDDRQHNLAQLTEAGHKLATTDVVHFQYNAHIWGGRDRQLSHLQRFLQACTTRRIATLHDIFYPPSITQLWQQYRDGKRSWLELPKAWARERLSPNIRALHTITAQCDRVLICTQTEAERLHGYVPTHQVQVVPHFVEARELKINAAKAREQLEFKPDQIVISLLGFIYRGKGHDLLVEALSHLPQNYIAVFAGGLGHQDFLDSVLSLAKQMGVHDRIRVTGYLSEADQELYLAATHLAVCPFKRTSASGSLSTWISANKPILASDLPQIQEYNRLQPRAIHTFSPYTAEALAIAIQHAVSQISNLAIEDLNRQLTMPVIFDRHLDQYAALIP